MTMTANLTIHRLLDEAFAGATADLQDLKEELRANLVARVEELEATGASPDEAARRAFDELGDMRALLAEAAVTGAGERRDRYRVRWNAAFVVRALVLPILAAMAIALAFLVAADAVPGGRGGAAGLVAGFAALLGFVCADSLRQETAASYPMPRGRATGYGLGLGLLLAGLGGIALCWLGPLWAWLVAGGTLAIAGIGVLAGLGATQTNRHKPWVLEATQAWNDEHPWAGGPASGPHAATRFDRDPHAAARFGIYTMLLWLVGTVIAVALGVFVGWWWSALPWIGAFIAMMLLLTRMLFAPVRQDD